VKPGRNLPPPSPGTHLWESGYLDSFAIIKVVDYLEEVTGHEIPIEPGSLSSFFTLDRIYDAYVEGAA
jgi:acyl carrier protein